MKILILKLAYTWIPDIPDRMKILILKVAYNLNSWTSSKQE